MQTLLDTYGSMSILIVVMPLGSRCLLSAALTATSHNNQSPHRITAEPSDC